MPDIVGLSKDEVMKLLLDMGWDESAITFEDVEVKWLQAMSQNRMWKKEQRLKSVKR